MSRIGGFDAGGVYVVDRRVFAGYWEYLLEDAIFTAPPRADFGGAALIDEDGRLVGIGSLIVNDAGQDGPPIPGNMFVPINDLKPIMGDLLANGRRSDPPRPWLGVSLEEHRGRVFVTRVTPEGPAAAAGIADERPDPRRRRRAGRGPDRLLSQALEPRRGRRHGAARPAAGNRAAGDGGAIGQSLPLSQVEPDLLTDASRCGRSDGPHQPASGRSAFVEIGGGNPGRLGRQPARGLGRRRRGRQLQQRLDRQRHRGRGDRRSRRRGHHLPYRPFRARPARPAGPGQLVRGSLQRLDRLPADRADRDRRHRARRARARRSSASARA